MGVFIFISFYRLIIFKLFQRWKFCSSMNGPNGLIFGQWVNILWVISWKLQLLKRFFIFYGTYRSKFSIKNAHKMAKYQKISNLFCNFLDLLTFFKISGTLLILTYAGTNFRGDKLSRSPRVKKLLLRVLLTYSKLSQMVPFRNFAGRYKLSRSHMKFWWNYFIFTQFCGWVYRLSRVTLNMQFCGYYCNIRER